MSSGQSAAPESLLKDVQSKDYRISLDAAEHWEKRDPKSRGSQVREVLKALSSKDSESRRFPCFALAGLRQRQFFHRADSPLGKEIAAAIEQSRQPLLKMLKEAESPFERAAAAYTLGQFQGNSPEVVPALVKALDDRDPKVRGEVSGALSKYGRDAAPAIPKLVEAIQRGIPYYVTRDGIFDEFAHPAAGVLATIGEPAYGEIRKGLDDRRFLVVYNSISAIAYIRGPMKDAVPRLIQLFEHPPELTELPPQRRQPPSDYKASIRRQALGALTALGKDAQAAGPVLIRALRENPNDYSIMESLRYVGAAKASAPLLGGVVNDKGKTPYIRVRAAIDLIRGGEGRGEDIVPAMAAIMSDRTVDYSTRGDSISTLSQFPESAREHLPILMRMLSDTSEEAYVRYNAAGVLLAIGGEAEKKAAMEFRNPKRQ